MASPNDPILNDEKKKRKRSNFLQSLLSPIRVFATWYCGKVVYIRRKERDHQSWRPQGWKPAEEEEKSTEEANDDVFLAMAPHLSPITPNGSNFLFSPISLRAVVGLIAAGASGPTLEQLLSFLKSDSVDDVNSLSSKLFSAVLAGNSGGPSNLSLANAIWVQQGLSLTHSFKEVVEIVYKASSIQLDFVNTNEEEIISEVNSWAKEQTNGLIQDVLSPGSVNQLTRFIVANALYFRGEWKYDYFEASQTKKHKFHLLSGKSIKVPFMTNVRRHQMSSYDGFKILCLPYKEFGEDDKRQFSMYILLPDSKDGLAALAEKVVSETDFLGRHLPLQPVLVSKFRLPRFKISYGFEASEALKRLGVSLPFEAGGLTEMVDSIEEGEELYVSKIHQKCLIEVNEEGTVAVAVGRMQLAATCGRTKPVPVRFVADHPFMFLIREDTTGVVLFYGHVLNPLDK